MVYSLISPAGENQLFPSTTFPSLKLNFLCALDSPDDYAFGAQSAPSMLSSSLLWSFAYSEY